MRPTYSQKRPGNLPRPSQILLRWPSGILRRSPRWVAVVLAILWLVVFVVQAATIEWANVGTSWSTGSNWVGGSAPADSTVTDIASFGSTGAAAINPNLTAARSTNGVAFLSGAFAYTIGGSALTIGNSGISDSATNAESFSNQIKTSVSQTWTSNSGATLVFSGIVDLNSNAASLRTLTLAGNGNFAFSNKIQNSSAGSTGSLTKTGSGAATLAGANTYTGGTVITAGTLTCGVATALPSTSAIGLNGGTLKTGATTGFSQSTGTLALTDSSAIALGTGIHMLTFSASNGVSWTASKTLTITGWTGGYNGTSGTGGKVFVGSTSSGLTASQLAQIVFFNGSRLYPATILSNGEVVPVASPTAVRLMNFTAAKSGDAVTLQWQSGFEAHNLGYYIYREQNGKRLQITPSIIAGSALRVGRQTVLSAGYTYTWYDQLPAGSSGAVTYWLEDVDLDGTRTNHGPITPLMARSSRTQESVARSPFLNELQPRIPSAGVLFQGWPATGARPNANRVPTKSGGRDEGKGDGCDFQQETAAYRTLSAQQNDIAGTPGVKLAVGQTGWYRVAQPELAAAGLDLSANASHLQLFANGQEVPIKVSGDGVRLTASDYIEFYGHGLNSTTDAAQTYYLLAGNSPGQRVTLVTNGPIPAPSGPQNYGYTIERKDRAIYYAAFLNGAAENIFGQVVTSTPLSLTLPVSHRDIAAVGQAQLDVSLVGVSFEDHHVHVKLNGADVGTIDFGMLGQPDEMFMVPPSLLHDGDNTVQLTSLGGSSDVSLADTVRLTYAHAYAADNDGLSISISSGATIRVNGFSSPSVRAVDITDPNSMQELTPLVAGQPDGSYAADLQIATASAAQPHTLLIFADAHVAHPDSIKHHEPSTWSANSDGADYLIITSHDFLASAQSLAQYRQSNGLLAKVIDVEDLYDEFSFGVHSPQAIRDFLQTATNTWTLKPRYVLLMGDASFDPKNYLEQGNTDFVPTKLFDTTLMETASDDWLADFDNDGVADLAIGRLPVRTRDDANLMVNKVIAFEKLAPGALRSALLVADIGFEGSNAAVAGVLPSSMTKQLINRSGGTDSAIHMQIVNGINQGPLLVNYLGHGSNGVWTGARILSNPDAQSLTNSDGLSVFAMMTCLNGYFEDAYSDSLAEALLRNRGGAVAVWASTGMTEPSGQNLVDQELYRQLFNGHALRLGDAVRAAKATTSDSDIRRTWTLFGDPAMRVVNLTPTATNGTISGTITNGQGAPVAGTTVSLSGAQTRQTITDSNGVYAFDSLGANGFYTVTPAYVSYSFSPASRSFSLAGVHTDASFIGTVNATPINPLDATDYFVRQQYLDFLGREPDEMGFNFWGSQIRSCGNDGPCLETQRINTSAAFFLSIEFQQTGYLVYRIYKSAYGDMANAPVPLKLNEFLPDTKSIGQGVVVNQSGWEQVLESNKQAFMTEFVQRSRFSSAYPTTMTPTAFVDGLFANAGVTPSGSDRADAIGEFGSALTSVDLVARGRALRRVGENRSLAQKEFNRAFVLMQYFGYLRRNPIDPPEATRDYGGYSFWLDKLNRFGGDFAGAEMVKAFLISNEYRQRFGQ